MSLGRALLLLAELAVWSTDRHPDPRPRRRSRRRGLRRSTHVTLAELVHCVVIATTSAGGARGCDRADQTGRPGAGPLPFPGPQLLRRALDDEALGVFHESTPVAVQPVGDA